MQAKGGSGDVCDAYFNRAFGLSILGAGSAKDASSTGRAADNPGGRSNLHRR